MTRHGLHARAWPVGLLLATAVCASGCGLVLIAHDVGKEAVDDFGKYEAPPMQRAIHAPPDQVRQVAARVLQEHGYAF